jgi:hypothetical protein
MVTFWALVQALPKLIALFQFVAGMVRDAEQRGLGRKEAVAEALTIAHEQLAMADVAEVQATQSHAKDKTDGAFDQDFKEG